MVKKSNSEFSNTKSKRGLDEALQRSFTNIKNDMTALKEGQHQHGVKLAETSQILKDSRSDFVTIDKFNILKIKIGELNENMKKVWDIEKKLEDVDRKSVSASEFDKHSVGVDNEITKLREDVKDLNKNSATEAQTKQLVKDINEEFDKVKKGIEELRSIKDTITRAEMDKRTDKLNKRADSVKDDVDTLKAKFKTKVDTTQVETLVNDVNSEFDSLKEMIADIKEGEKAFALESDVDRRLDRTDDRLKEMSEATTVAVDEFAKGVEQTFKDFANRNEKMHDALSEDTDKVEKKLSDKLDKLKAANKKDNTSLKKDMKLLMSKKQGESLVKDLNKEFDSVKDEIDENAKFIAALNKDSATRKELTAVTEKLKKDRKSEVEKVKKEMKELWQELKDLRQDAADSEETESMFKQLKEKITDINSTLKTKLGEFSKKMKKSSEENAKSIKSNSQDINLVEKDMKKELKSRVSDDDLHDELDVIKAEFERMHKELKSIKDDMADADDVHNLNKRLKGHMADTKKQKKELVSKKQFDKLLDAVDRMSDQLDDQNALMKEKDKNMKVLAKELKAERKANKKLARYDSVVVKSGKKAKKTAKKGKKAPAQPFRKSRFLANFLIGAAFVILVAAVVFFFSGLAGITDMLAIAAVVCFVIGIIIRIVIGFKGNGN